MVWVVCRGSSNCTNIHFPKTSRTSIKPKIKYRKNWPSLTGIKWAGELPSLTLLYAVWRQPPPPVPGLVNIWGKQVAPEYYSPCVDGERTALCFAPVTGSTESAVVRQSHPVPFLTNNNSDGNKWASHVITESALGQNQFVWMTDWETESGWGGEWHHQATGKMATPMIFQPVFWRPVLRLITPSSWIEGVSGTFVPTSYLEENRDGQIRNCWFHLAAGCIDDI